jgi:hypothetical protein
MQISLKLLESDNHIRKLILDGCAETLNDAIVKASPQIQHRVRNDIGNIIRGTNEYISLIGGALRMDFGLQNPQSVVDALIALWQNELSVTISRYRTRGQNIVGKFEINAVDETFSNVLRSPYATYLSSGYKIDWLSWLLQEGTASVIRGYEVVYTNAPYSRSGYALMKPVLGGSFAVNPAYAGTKTNNFITRAMAASEDRFLNIIQEEVERAL